ncbi:hypothetical protein [Nocardia lijiangensis]|uniref:hypothetical protein n=1 Tax=Nocardia lijiangensis TaxID=299618 RepID=UPI00082A97B1|nr:hypothetical protein [Nocardia lijiangensis]
MAEQGAGWASFIHDQLEREYSRRDTLNTRAASAVTSATGLVTLVLAVVAVLKGKDFTLTGAALVALYVAMLALLGSAVLAVLAGVSWRYRVTSLDSMRAMLTEHWRDAEVDARYVAAYCNLESIASLRAGTSLKAYLLMGAAGMQVLSILAMATSALILVA